MSTNVHSLEPFSDSPPGALPARVGRGLVLAKDTLRLPALLVAKVVAAVRHARHAWRLARSRVRLAFGFEPLSYQWGGDRGTPLHYYYIFQFLDEFRPDVRGHCLEFYGDHYTTAIGGEAVMKVDILHIDDTNPNATLIGDLTKPNAFPSDRFDCIICTHTLHVIYDLDKATAEMYRMLKPGGVLLVGSPVVSMCDPEGGELWRFTAEGQRRLLARTFGDANVTVRFYGNSLTAAGMLRGMVVEDFTRAELSTHDERFALEVCGRARKPERPSGDAGPRSA